MFAPEPNCKPHLAAGCRWAESTSDPNAVERTLLFPEGAIKVEGTGRAILELCDGESTVMQITQELQALFEAADPVRIRTEVMNFLQQLHEQRVVDY
ncbi:MAG: pyrroloquinoline quinone biosynthesis peptide chaperone PqqD [Acidobacteriota bacterium]|nr:pyrroloquinoline quinone biosynthesis peptide chaperone PqqD [Acidobacteriota bacterium]